MIGLIYLIYDTMCVSAFVCVCVKISMPSMPSLCVLYLFVYIYIYIYIYFYLYLYCSPIIANRSCLRLHADDLKRHPPTRRTLAAGLAWPPAAHANSWPKYFTDFSQIRCHWIHRFFTDSVHWIHRFFADFSQIFDRSRTPGNTGFTDFSQILDSWIHTFFTDFSQK